MQYLKKKVMCGKEDRKHFIHMKSMWKNLFFRSLVLIDYVNQVWATGSKRQQHITGCNDQNLSLGGASNADVISGTHFFFTCEQDMFSPISKTEEKLERENLVSTRSFNFKAAVDTVCRERVLYKSLLQQVVQS